MDFPTLVYLLALIGYSLFTWWKKGKAGKNAQKPATGETREPEVPEWMKEIFGEAFENTPQAPKPAMEETPASPPGRRRTTPASQKPQIDPSKSVVPPLRGQSAELSEPFMHSDDRSLQNMYLMEQKKRASMSTKPEIKSTNDVSAYEIGAETTAYINTDEENWKRAIILAEVIKPYTQQQR
jgi:hypothetical protein